MKIYVVSLRRATARRQAIQAQLESYGLDFEFIDAVDAREMDPEELRAHVDSASVLKSLGRQMSGPEIGCSLSHRLAYRDLVENNYPGAVILEDDAILTSGFHDCIKYFRSHGHHLRNRWKIFDFGAISLPCSRGFVFRNRSAVSVSSRIVFRKLLTLLSFEKNGTFSYYITAQAASKILEIYPIQSVADKWSLYARRGRGEIYICSPSVVLHPDDFETSDISQARDSISKEIHKNIGYIKKVYLYIYGGVRIRVIDYLIRPISEKLL